MPFLVGPQDASIETPEHQREYIQRIEDLPLRCRVSNRLCGTGLSCCIHQWSMTLQVLLLSNLREAIIELLHDIGVESRKSTHGLSMFGGTFREIIGQVALLSVGLEECGSRAGIEHEVAEVVRSMGAQDGAQIRAAVI
jgi:hypothetical protein